MYVFLNRRNRDKAMATLRKLRLFIWKFRMWKNANVKLLIFNVLTFRFLALFATVDESVMQISARHNPTILRYRLCSDIRTFVLNLQNSTFVFRHCRNRYGAISNLFFIFRPHRVVFLVWSVCSMNLFV